MKGMTKKSNGANFVAFIIVMVLFSTNAYATDLTIHVMNDITANCQYDSGTRTYSCTGWDNIYVQSDITLPFVNPSYGKHWGTTSLWNADPTNIIFHANNEFSAKNFYATNPGGYGGYINIEANKITATSLNTYGTACNSGSCTAWGPFCGNSNGGDVILKADTVNVGTINANQGGGANGAGGKVSITASSTIVTNIYSDGGGYTCSYDYGYDNGEGSGGTVIIKSGTASLGSISLNGGGSNYCGHGRNGGSVKLAVNDLTLGSVSANGASMGGSGGRTIIYSDKCTLGKITESGKTGYEGSSCGTADGQGGLFDLFTGSKYCRPPSASNLNVGDAMISKRARPVFFVFETDLSSGYKSFKLNIKDTVTGGYVNSVDGSKYELTGAISGGHIKAFVGKTTKVSLSLGTYYNLVLTASTGTAFDSSRCGSGDTCKEFVVQFIAR